MSGEVTVYIDDVPAFQRRVLDQLQKVTGLLRIDAVEWLAKEMTKRGHKTMPWFLDDLLKPMVEDHFMLNVEYAEALETSLGQDREWLLGSPKRYEAVMATREKYK